VHNSRRPCGAVLLSSVTMQRNDAARTPPLNMRLCSWLNNKSWKSQGIWSWRESGHLPPRLPCRKGCKTNLFCCMSDVKLIIPVGQVRLLGSSPTGDMGVCLCFNDDEMVNRTTGVFHPMLLALTTSSTCLWSYLHVHSVVAMDICYCYSCY